MFALSALTVLAAAPLLFGDEEIGWYVVSEAGEVLEHMPDFGGERASEATVSPDGRVFAFVTADAIDSRRLLLWRRGEPKPSEVQEGRGFYAHPVFDADGQWLYFTRNDSGAPGSHRAGKNAQVFRARVGEGDAEQLTQSPGCKLTPAPAKHSVMYLHSSCQRTATAEVMSLDGTDGGAAPGRGFGQAGWNAVELATTRDGRRVAVVESRMPGVIVHELRTSGAAHSRVLAQFPDVSTGLQPCRARQLMSV